MTTAQDGGKVVSLTQQPPLPQEMFLIIISVRGWVDPRAMVRSEGLRQWKIPMTPAGIESATFLFVAQHLNHCATAVPLIYLYFAKYLRTVNIPTLQYMLEICCAYNDKLLSFQYRRSHDAARDRRHVTWQLQFTFSGVTYADSKHEGHERPCMQPVKITRIKRSTKYKHDVKGGDDNNDIPTVSVNSHSTRTRKLFE